MSGSAAPIGVIVNPNSRKNRRAGGRVARLQRIVGRHGHVCETPDLEALGPALDALLAEGARYLVSDGGDGALHWLLNELEARRDPDASRIDPVVLPTNGGTIDFVARKAGVEGRAEGILRRLVATLERDEEPAVAEVDTLAIAAPGFHRIGFALAAGGIGNRFFDKYYAEPDPSASSIPRIVARTLASQLANRAGGGARRRFGAYAREIFSPTRARVRIDDRELEATEHGALHAGSIDIQLGGLVRVFPLASARGRLHFQAGDVAPREIIRSLPAIYRGAAIEAEGLTDVDGARMEVEALGDEPLAPIVDGERFSGLERIEVGLGPTVRVARIRA